MFFIFGYEITVPFIYLFSLLRLFVVLSCTPFHSMITKLFEKGFFRGIKRRSNRTEHLQKVDLLSLDHSVLIKWEKIDC